MLNAVEVSGHVPGAGSFADTHPRSPFEGHRHGPGTDGRADDTTMTHPGINAYDGQILAALEEKV